MSSSSRRQACTCIWGQSYPLGVSLRRREQAPYGHYEHVCRGDRCSTLVLLGIACGTVPQPGEDPEGQDADDVMTRNDIEKLCSTGPNSTYTSAFLENMYVVFLDLKDLLWSLGTGSIGVSLAATQKAGKW